MRTQSSLCQGLVVYHHHRLINLISPFSSEWWMTSCSDWWSLQAEVDSCASQNSSTSQSRFHWWHSRLQHQCLDSWSAWVHWTCLFHRLFSGPDSSDWVAHSVTLCHFQKRTSWMILPCCSDSYHSCYYSLKVSNSWKFATPGISCSWV